MMRVLMVAFAVIISTSVYFTIRYGLRPKPIPILNPTAFQGPEQVGAVLYRGLRQVVSNEKLILLGSNPEVEMSSPIWEGFLKAAAADGVQLRFYFHGPEVTPLEAVLSLERKRFSPEDVAGGILESQVAQKIKEGVGGVIHASVLEASHLVEDSLSRRLERPPNAPVLAISVMPWALQPESLQKIGEQCAGAELAEPRMRKLICAQHKLGRKFLKKKLDATKLWAAAERHGLKEYVVFVHSPD